MTPEATEKSIGRYEVVRLLGHGAMGRVLLAHDPVLDRSVAVKLLRGDLKIPEEQREGLVKRMRQEARASARVSHPHIVALHDMGNDPALGLYLVFEYAEGITLKQRLVDGPLAAPAAARLARELGDALTTAHDDGVLHRDVKPENIILSRHGAKIADFGIARVPNSTLTQGGRLLGTPAYSSPESVDKGEFSPRSDQFSLAATLYEAISGQRAFPGDDAIAVATRITTETPRRVARRCKLSPQVDQVLLRGMAKPALDRFATCREFGNALATALEGNPRMAMPTLPDTRHRNAAEGETRVRRAALLGAALGAVVMFGAAEWLRNTEGSTPATSPAGVRRADAPTLAPATTGWLARAPRARSDGQGHGASAQAPPRSSATPPLVLAKAAPDPQPIPRASASTPQPLLPPPRASASPPPSAASTPPEP